MQCASHHSTFAECRTAAVCFSCGSVISLHAVHVLAFVFMSLVACWFGVPKERRSNIHAVCLSRVGESTRRCAGQQCDDDHICRLYLSVSSVLPPESESQSFAGTYSIVLTTRLGIRLSKSCLLYQSKTCACRSLAHSPTSNKPELDALACTIQVPQLGKLVWNASYMIHSLCVQTYGMHYTKAGSAMTCGACTTRIYYTTYLTR